MTEIACPICRKKFESTTVGRPKKFCSRKCFRQWYRKNASSGLYKKTGKCDVCKKPLIKTKRHQRYCSRLCYSRSWVHNNRAKHNARSVRRRKEQPEWYRKYEPKYYRTYRKKLTSLYPWAYCLKSAKSRAKENSLLFELTDTWAASRWTGKCSISGIAFRPNKSRGPWPFSPTIDRINPKIGYTKRNSRFVLWGVNAIKGVGTDADMYIIAKAIVSNVRKD